MANTTNLLNALYLLSLDLILFPGERESKECFGLANGGPAVVCVESWRFSLDFLYIPL